MSNSKGKTKVAAGVNAAIGKANQAGCKKFPKAALKKALGIIGDTATQAETSQAEKQTAALSICKLAHRFMVDNTGIDIDTVTVAWRDSFKPLALELATAGNRFAELREAKGDNAATAVMTGYGRNVISIAKGCIEFELEPQDSYRECRELVEAKRAERDRAKYPDKAAMADAIDLCHEQFSTLLDLVVEQQDAKLVGDLTTVLAETQASVVEQIKEQAELQKKADEEKTATAGDEAAELAALELATKPDDEKADTAATG